MPSYGTTTLVTGGRGVQASAEGTPRWKAGGVTIDWSTVTAVVADTTLLDGTVVKAGQKYLRYGKVLCRITASGKFGPYDVGAADGRQALVVGQCFILNQTVVMDTDLASDHPAVFDGGRVFVGRVTDIAAIGTHQIANPTRVLATAGFPGVTWVED
jgi:hypothetical protein